jgi:5-oxoprolinase (ATP-hydrolysing)
MTNTRITDSEVFERRYPVLLREFSLREGSAGEGQHKGGEGVVRDIEFRIPVQVSILSERRVYRPYGMAGGEDAACGRNLWVRKVDPRVRDENSDSERPVGQTASTTDTEKKEGAKQEEEYRTVNLGGKNTASMKPGERIIIQTPGGGGWGKMGDAARLERKDDPRGGWKGGSVAERMRAGEASA